MVANVDHLYVLVGPAQEQIEQDVETLGHLLGGLIHGTGDIHQAEHHRLAGGHGPLDEVVELEIEGVDERYCLDPPFQLSDLLFELCHLGKMFVGIDGQQGQPLLQLTQLALLARLQRHATRQRILQRAHHVDVGGHPVGGVARAVGLHLHQLVELGLLQPWQLQILKQQVQVLVFRDLEHEVVSSLALIRGLAFAPALTAAPSLGAVNLVTGDELIVARVHHLPFAALALMEMGFTDVLGRDADALALVHVLNAALGDSIRDRLFDLLLVAADEALPIDSAFVFAVEPAVDKMRHNSPLNTAGSG
ncbi:hypothetical protein D3C84_331090 [compost metagenome]